MTQKEKLKALLGNEIYNYPKFAKFLVDEVAINLLILAIFSLYNQSK